MLGALIIVFREVIEAGLIVGIVLAVTQGLARQPARDRGGRLSRGCRRVARGRLCRRDRRSLGRGRPGDFQRLDPPHRRRDADLAQRLDGEPWPRTCRRRQAGRRGGARRLAIDLRAWRCLRRRGDARRLGGCALHVWSRRGRGLNGDRAPHRLASRACRGRRRDGADLSRFSGDPAAALVRRDDRRSSACSPRASPRRRCSSCSRRAF